MSDFDFDTLHALHWAQHAEAAGLTERALGAARADALVGRMPAASTKAVTWAARPLAFQGAWREWARRRISPKRAASTTRRRLRSVVAESWLQANGACNTGG